MGLQALFRRLTGAALSSQGFGVCKLGVRKPGLLGLYGSLRLVQGTAGGAMRSSFCFQRGFQFCDARLEYCCWITVAPAVQDNHRNSAILHEAVAWTCLISALLGSLAGRALQTQGTTHSVFSRLCVVR